MSTSYAYDPSGKKVAVTIKDGKSYLADGSRIPTGYTVQTGGGVYKMTDSGGVKVDAHNQIVNTLTNSNQDKETSGRVAREATNAGQIAVDRAPQPSGYTKAGNTYVINKDIFANDPIGSYTRSRSDFNTKYDDIIKSLATYNNVDMSVAEEMLKTNLDQNKGIYAGGGVIPTEKWNEMLNDYKTLKDSATISATPGGITPTGNTEIDQALIEYGKYSQGGGSPGNSEITKLLSQLNKGVLSYEDAKKLADAQLGRDYDKSLTDTMKNIDRQSLQQGFFGQLPTMDYKQRNADEITLNKEQALAQLAYQLMNDSEADAQNYLNTLMNYNNSEWEKAYKERAYADSRTDTAWEKAYKESGLTGIFQGKPTLAMTELAHAIGMDEKKMQMAEVELNHEIEMAFENLKNDKVALSQAWARIGQTAESNKLDKEKFMAGIKEQAWKMTMDQMDKQGVDLGDGMNFDSWLDTGGPTTGGSAMNNAQLEKEIETIWGSYIQQLLGDTQFSGYYK